MDVRQALERCGGAARTHQLTEFGCTPLAIANAVAEGRILRVAKGVYALANASPAFVLAVKLNGGLTCVSALERLALPLPRPPVQPHIAVARNFSPRGHALSDARFHYYLGRPAPGEILSAARALDCAGGCLDDVWHLVALDAALNRALVTLGDVMDFTRCTSSRRDFLLRYADARSESPGETIARLQLTRAGHKVRPQAYIDGAGRVDMEVDDLVILQVDGYASHSEPRAFRVDREKSRAVAKAGRPQLTYAASELVAASPVNVVHDVRAALAEWRVRDAGRIRPSRRRIVTVRRDATEGDPSGR